MNNPILWAVHIGDGLEKNTICKFIPYLENPNYQNQYLNENTQKIHTVSSYDLNHIFSDTPMGAVEKFEKFVIKRITELKNEIEEQKELTISLYLQATKIFKG